MPKPALKQEAAMQFTIDAETLREMLDSSVAPVTHHMPILSHALITVGDDGEGMEVSKEKFEELIADFYAEEF